MSPEAAKPRGSSRSGSSILEPAEHQRLPASFFAREVAIVARDLLGRLLARDDVVLRITEVEAYGGPEDTASHCRAGRTARNAAMWGPPGHAYVYLCYGIHSMLNLVCDRDGRGSAVLVRSCALVSGEAIVLARRRATDPVPSLVAGPGKVGAALALDTSWSGHPLFEPGGLECWAGKSAEGVVVGPRVGVDYASPVDRDAPLRFAVAGESAVSHRRSLRAESEE